MTDDELLKALGETARKGAAHDPRWPALAGGTLSEPDQVALAALAEGSEEGRAAHDAFRPIDEAAKERAVDRIMALGADEGPGPASGRRAAPRRRAVDWSTALSVGALAAALAFFLFLWPRRHSDAPVPGYALSMQGDVASRAEPVAPDTVMHLGPRSRAEITLRPASAVQGPLAVRCFLAQDGRVRDWDAPVQVAPTGAVHLEGERASLFVGVPAGRWEMVFAVGRPGALPSAAGVLPALRRGDAGGNASSRLLRAVVILEGDPP